MKDPLCCSEREALTLLVGRSSSLGPLTHDCLKESVKPVFTAGSWVLNSPLLLFIVPLIALNAAAFLVRLARL